MSNMKKTSFKLKLGKKSSKKEKNWFLGVACGGGVGFSCYWVTCFVGYSPSVHNQLIV